MSEMVNHPKHYNSHPSGVEVIEVVRFMSFNLGNAAKYLMRLFEKGNPLQDAKKALWYLNDQLTALPYLEILTPSTKLDPQKFQLSHILNTVLEHETNPLVEEALRFIFISTYYGGTDNRALKLAIHAMQDLVVSLGENRES